MNSLGTDIIYTLLNGETSITDLLDDISDSDNDKAIYNDLVLPEDCTGNKTILIYQSSTVGGGECFDNVTITIDCRGGIPGKTSGGLKDATTIQKIVRDFLDRRDVQEYMIVADMLPVIPPRAGMDDNYNAPVSARVKIKKAL